MPSGVPWGMLTLLIGAALAAPPDYRVTKTTDDGCELSLGPAEADGVVPMRAECTWDDVDLGTFERKLGDWAGHDEIFSVVVDSTIKRTDGDRTLAYQKHRSKGIGDREILLWMTHTTVDGFERYGWTKAGDEPLEVASGNVAAARSDGYWQAKAAPGGGIVVVHWLAYDPGGSVPGFLVRWFQTSGLETNLTEMHTALTAK